MENAQKSAVYQAKNVLIADKNKGFSADRPISVFFCYDTFKQEPGNKPGRGVVQTD